MDPTTLQFFGYGLLLGCLAAVWVAYSAWRRRRGLELELQRLRRHLDDHMEITNEGATQRKLELTRLKDDNERLRVAIKAWQEKPDRRQIRMLMVYDRAVRQISSTAPGFSAHWENALRDAEHDVEQMDRGLLAFARRLILPTNKSPSTDEK